MKKVIVTLLLAVTMIFGLCGMVSAADQGILIGYVNEQTVLRNYPDFASANSAIELEQQKAQQEFDSKAASLDDKGRQELNAKLVERINKRAQDLMVPLRKKVRTAIETVAKRNGISTVVDSAAMLYGGKDLTREVIEEVTKGSK